MALFCEEPLAIDTLHYSIGARQSPTYALNGAIMWNTHLNGSRFVVKELALRIGGSQNLRLHTRLSGLGGVVTFAVSMVVLGVSAGGAHLYNLAFGPA